MRKFPSRTLRRVLQLNFFTPRISNSDAKTEANLPPGTMVYVGEERAGAPEISLVTFTLSDIQEFREQNLDELMSHIAREQITWVNIDGIHDISLINEVAERFQLHPLTREDIVNTTQIPKAEVYESYLFLPLKMFSVKEQSGKIDIEQISLILGDTFVMSLQEKTEDVLEPIRDRIRQAKGQVRKQQADYLFYALLDIIASNYLIVVNHIARQIDLLEEDMTESPGAAHLNDITEYRKTLLYLRRYIAPLRDQILLLQRGHSTLIRKKTLPYFQDLQDLLTQTLADIDTYRDILKNISDQNLAMASHRMNEVMKVLTIVSTVFIPLSFIVGLYGMNFDHIPELHWKYGYPMVWGLMLSVSAGMLVFFRLKKWL